MKDTKHDIKENNEVPNDDATVACFVDGAVKPVPEEENNLEEKPTSDEEFECSSVTVSSEGEKKIAALDEKSRRLKAQFAEENRLAIESMDKIREEIKQSQEREDAITNDMEEMRKRQDDIKQDLRRLDELSKRREREEEKWKSKIDKKKKKIGKRLEKIRADRLKYQQETEAENETTENQDYSAVQCNDGAGHQMEHEGKDAAKTTSSFPREDTSNIILYEPHEVKEYSSVKQLEKKRKELRRLEKMEKKAIKREKLEQRERKKIEKEKRKVARKLEKLRAKNAAATEKNQGSSASVNNQAQGASSTLLQGNSEEPQTINETEHQTTYLTATCDVNTKQQDAPGNKGSDRDLTEGHSSLHERELRPSVSNGVIGALENPELDISEDIKMPVSDIIICETEVAGLAPGEIHSTHQRSFKLQNDKFVATGGSVGEELEEKPYSEFAMENSKESSHSGDNQMDNENASEDVEIDCLQKEDTLKDISVELFSIEEQLDLSEPHNNPKCGEELEMNCESEECASKTAVSEYDELSSLRGEILVNNTFSKMEVAATGTVGASGKQEKTSDFTATNTRPLESAAKCVDNISVCSEMAYDDIPLLCFNIKEALAKSDAFGQIYGGSNDNYDPLECLVDADLEQCTRSKGNKRTGKSHEQSVPRLEYVKEDGDDVPNKFVNDGNDDTIDITMSDESFHDGNPSCAGNGSLLANEPCSLMRKVSSRFKFGGLQPLCYSPGTGELNSTFEDTVPSEEEIGDKGRGEDDQIPLEENSSLEEEEIEDKGRDEDDQIPLEENSSLEHLETGSFEDETCSQDYAMSFKDLTKEMQEALVQRYAACTDVEGADNVEVEIVYEEVSRRSSDENSFSIVCEEASVQTCDDEKWMEQDVKEEIDDVSIRKSSSSKEALVDLVKKDETKMKQELKDDLETKPEVQRGGRKVETGCDRHELRDGIDEHGLMEVSQPSLIAREALSFQSSPINSPDFLDSTAEDSDNSDDFLDKVEEAAQIAENHCGAKTVGISKLVGAFAQSTVQSPECKIQEVHSDHDNNESLEKSRGLKQDTPSHQEIYEDTNVPMATANTEENRKSVVDSEEALNYSHSQQPGNGEDVGKAFLDRNVPPVTVAPKEPDSLASSNNALQSDYSGDKDDYSSASKTSSFGNKILEKTNDQKLFLGSENTDVLSRGEVSDFAYFIKGTLAETKVQYERHPVMDLDDMNERNQQMMEENAENDEDSFDEKAVCDFSKKLDKVRDIVTETSRADVTVERAANESPVSNIEEVLREDSKFEICDTGDELDSWGSIDDMLSSDAHGANVGKEESAAPYLPDDVNKASHHMSEEEDRKSHEFGTSPVSSLESNMASRELHRDNLLSPHSVVGISVKSTNNEVFALEIKTDTKLDSVDDLALPRANGIKNGVSSAHQDISVCDNYDETLAAAEEFQRIEFHEEPVLQVAPGMGSSCQKDKKATAIDVKAIGGDIFVSVDSINDETLDASLEDKFPEVDRPSKMISQSPHAAKKLVSGKGKVKNSRLNEDEFIDDFDQLLDEVEEDIRIEESMSSPESNPHSLESKPPVEEIQDQSIDDVESVTWVTDFDSEELLLSSCDEEVAAINDSTLEVISEDEEEPDSWDALHEPVDRRFQSRDSSIVLNNGESRVSDERRRANYERRIAAVVNISECILHQELLAAIKAAACEVTKIDALEDEVKQSAKEHHVHKDDINSPALAKDKLEACVTSKETSVTFSGEKATIGDAIEQLNKLHSMVIDIREQTSGRNVTKEQRFAVKTETYSVPVLLNSISALDDNIREMAEELNQATEKSNKGKVKREENIGAEMLEESKKEKDKMLVEITIMQEEVVALKEKSDALCAELEATKAELKCLQSRDEYKQRELTNLKNDFERKQKMWDDAEESLENALKDKLELLDEVEFLEDSLRLSTENNERLENRVDELNETIKELKKRGEMDNKRHEYGHLREEVELLKGSLELSNQRKTLMRCQVEGLEAEVSNFKHCEQALKSNLKTEINEKSRIIEQLKKQLSAAENENARMIAELSRASDKEILLSEHKTENMSVIKQLQDQLNKLTKENSMLNAELSKVSENDNQMTELKSETTKVIKQLEDQVATLKKENNNLATELYKVSEKDDKIAELKSEMSTIIKHLEGQVTNLEKENHNLATELCKLSEKNSEMIELKDKTSKFMNELEDQLAALKKENSMLSTELYKASEKDVEMTEFKSETSKVIEQLEDQLVTLRKENSMLSTELYKASEKDIEMTEFKSETSKVIEQLEDQLATLRKENSMLSTELYKASEKDIEMTEFKSEASKLIEQLEDQLATLRKENSMLKAELYKASENDYEMSEFKSEASKVIEQLEDQLATLRKKNSMLKAELYEVSEKGNQLSEQKREMSKVINKLEDQLATLKKENSTLVTELLKKDDQISELQSETSNVIKQLENQLAKLKKENFTLATELSKVSEKDKQFTELCNQVENLMTQNKLLQDQALKAEKQFSENVQCPQEETRELGEGSMRSRRSRRSKSSDIKALKKRIRQNEQELEFLGRFIRQRGLEFVRRPQYHIHSVPKDETVKLPNAKDTLNPEHEHGKTNQDNNPVPEMENTIEGIRNSLQQKENDLQKTKDALTLKTERTAFLERRVEETEMLLEEKNKLLRENQCNLQQTDETLRQQLERSAILETQLQPSENARNTAITSIMNKDQELGEAFPRICQNDERIGDLIHQLKQERLDKECLKRAIEVTEHNALREKGLLQRLRELENQLQQTEELKEKTLASLMDKQQELEQLYRSVSNKDAEIDDLTVELKQERIENDNLKRAITVTECNANKEKGLLERSTQLEKRLHEAEELREITLVSFKNNKEALEQANSKIDELNQRLKRQVLNNECLRRTVEDTECNAKREKGLLEKQKTQFEIQLQEIERLQEKTQSSLKIKDTELQQVYNKLSRMDDTIDELKQELRQERYEKRELRKTTERNNSNIQRQKILLENREEEVKRLKEQLCDYEKEVETSNLNLKQIRMELEVAENILTYLQGRHVCNAGISSRIHHDPLEVFPAKQSKHTKKNFRGIGSSMVQVAERLRKLLQRQKEVDSSAALLKQKETEAKRAVERLREELNQRDDEMESLKSSLLKSMTEAECTRGRLREVEYQNIDLKKNLADDSAQVKKLEILVKELEGDIQRAQKSLKDKETTLEETKERLQLKSSLLTSMEAKLCLRDKEIEEFRGTSKERGLELERVQRSLKEVKKELEISSSTVTKQNEELIHLRSNVNRKSWEEDKIKFVVEPTQHEVKLLTIQLECAKKEKQSLSRELAAVIVRLENEQVLADRQKKALQEQVKSGLEDLENKTKLIWDMKMSLRESRARISRLEAEKLEQDECFSDYKRNFASDVKQLTQSLNIVKENEGLLQSGIGSAEHEMSELRQENLELKFKLLLKETGESPQDGVEDTSSGLFKVRLAFVVIYSFGVYI